MSEESVLEKRLNAVFKDCKSWSADPETLKAFMVYLENNLTLPCEVLGIEDQANYTLAEIENSGDELYGILGKVCLTSDAQQQCLIPLCDLKVIDNRSKNFELISDYSIWFSNAFG